MFIGGRVLGRAGEIAIWRADMSVLTQRAGINWGLMRASLSAMGSCGSSLVLCGFPSGFCFSWEVCFRGWSGERPAQKQRGGHFPSS